jgi:phosphoadenosine phosphosulfate reductase
MIRGQTAIVRADEPPFVASDHSRIYCEKVHAALEPLTAAERILWAAETFSERLVLLSSMQKTAVILMHMFKQLGLTNDVLFIDTGYHFVETLRMRDDCMRAWRLNLVTLYPSLTLEDQESQHHAKLFLSNDGQPTCCRLRKEAPLLDYLATIPLPVVAGGLRRSEGGRRANLQVLSPDLRTGGHQFSPIFDWSDADVEEYTAKHQLPIHPLYQKGYLSIGCYPCTTPVAPGEDARAGRWRHLRCAGRTDETHYCGVNFSDGDGI